MGSSMKAFVLYGVVGAFTAVGSGTVVGFCLQVWLGAHRFTSWRGDYIWVYNVMALSAVTGTAVALWARSIHRSEENW
ncbi:hypothetical protein ACSYAY_06160 [Leptospirillum ferriphilum]|jgi:integral membrane sensor domain MASE1|uniref:Uncharacterized protein n=4 Tax=Nitrospiraceae TaxID=189779 RepID=A0A059Y084_9BACT|nr:hypothetical protein [Leptospirillum ferriphilum]AKS24053.1 hypothetical protein ABH19_10375 [Leptospirillum sp. Group II 'CF-1']EAY56725.1 MAG: hypothetical protein UBAL2_80490001 [Leptospirillum rubarum]EIJ76649.1 MAG: Hypothetical protein C75L2_00380014 [Leptospirillum sp. Group II 'C75']MCL4461789.1 hypothetical protein [Nitrospirota bacterium]AFS54166.1 hypothetical protein LFML04_1966 [Leptospirillum ferriphilum ML-04]